MIQVHRDRGHMLSFLLSVLLWVAVVAMLFFFYARAHDFVHAIWASSDNAYLELYRSGSARAWRLAERSAAYPIVLLLPIFWLTSAGLMQLCLRMKSALRFNKLHAWVISGCGLWLLLNLLRLLQMPLPIGL